MGTGRFVKTFWFLVIFLASGICAAGELMVTLEFEPPVQHTTAVGEVLSLPGTEAAARPGEPLLPQRTLNFLLPYGHLPAGLRLEGAVVEPLPGVFRIAPAQRPVPLSRLQAAPLTPPDPLVYGQDHPFPPSFFQAGSVQRKHGYAILPVTVYPLSYRPRSGKVTRLVSATLVVVTKPGGSVSPLYRADPTDAGEVMRAADVLGALDTYPRKAAPLGPTLLPPGSCTYLIVTPQVFVGLPGPNSLEALRDARTALGLPARIETLEWIRTSYAGVRPDGGQDDATRIREFLTDARRDWGTRYVLLVGDADAADRGGESGDDLLQVRKLYVNMGYDPQIGQDMADHLPADLYYSCLDGTFDYDADGVYGEYGDGPAGGEVDLLAELYIGRAPADSAQEVENFVAKTLAYEQGAGIWLKEVWMLGEYLFEGPVWGGDYMDELIAGSNVGGFTTLGFSSFPFFECHTLYDRDRPAPWSSSDLMPILNNGPHIVNHLGHSDVTYNMRLELADADRLVNPHPFLLYSQGCMAGSFDNRAPADMGDYVYSQDCIAEHFVMGGHGAFGAIMNSRYGLGAYGTDGPSQRFHRQFWDAFFAEGKTTVGEALADSKEDNAAGFAFEGIRWAGYTVNLLGDPAVSLKKSLGTTDPLLGVYPPELIFYSIVGEEAPSPATLHVRNDGLGALGYTAQPDQSWLKVFPASGPVPSDVEVRVDLTGLPPSLHQGLIRFTSAEAKNSPWDVPVELVLVEVPKVRVPHLETAPSLDGVIAAGEYTGAISLPIDRQDTGEVTLALMVSGTKLYLAIDDRLDNTAGEYDQVLLIFDRYLDGQWPGAPADEGVYWMMGDRPVFLPIFNPGTGYDLGDSVSYPPGFEGKMGFVDNHRVYELSLDLEISHLDVGPNGAFSMFFQVRDTADWNNRTTTGWWPATVPEIDDQRFFGLVDLAPTGPRLDSSPNTLVFEAVVNLLPPDPATLSIFDREGGSIAYTASTSAGWLTVSSLSGQTPDGIEVAVDHTGLGLGNYYAQVILESPGVWNSPYSVPVTLRVLTAPARLLVTPSGFSITAAEDAPDPSLNLTLENQGGRPMSIQASSPDGWITLNPSQGELGPAGSLSVEVRVLLARLTRGIHQSQVVVDGHGAQGSPANLPIQVEVVGPRPVPPVETLLLERLDGALGCSWKKPDDPIVYGVLLRRGLAVPPESPALGDLVYDGADQQLTDTGLKNGTRYCYSAFAHDAAGRFAAPATACAAPGENRPPPVPRLLSPADGARLSGAPLLVAAAVVDPDRDAVSYTFRLLDQTGNTELETGEGEVSGDRISWMPSVELQIGSSYRWQVEAVDDQGARSGLSGAWSFSLQAAPDGGTDGGGRPDESPPGCGCAHGGSSDPLPALLLWIAGLVFFRFPKRAAPRS